MEFIQNKIHFNTDVEYKPRTLTGNNVVNARVLHLNKHLYKIVVNK